MTVVGRAGVGKTALVCRLLKALEAGHLPDDLGPLRPDGIVYLSATGTRRINVPNLFADLCKLLPDATAAGLDAVYRNPQASTEAKMAALLAEFPGRTPQAASRRSSGGRPPGGRGVLDRPTRPGSCATWKSISTKRSCAACASSWA